MNFKRLFSCVVMITMIGTSSNAFAEAAPSIENNKTWSIVKDIKEKGEKVATQEITYIYERTVNKDDVTVELTTKDHYEFSSKISADLKDILKDETEIVTLKRNDNNEYFIDGTKIDKETLSQPLVVPAPKVFHIAASQDTGGVPQISHYYGDYTTYSFDTYSKLTNTFGPGGNHASATGNINNSYVVRSMNTIDRFYDHYSSFRTALSTFSASMGGVLLTWETLIGGIIGGVGAIASAVQARDSFNDCNSDLSNAYNYVKRI